MWNTNACQQKPPLILWGTMQVHAWYSEVVVELYCMWKDFDLPALKERQQIG